MDKPLTHEIMLNALGELDELLPHPIELIIGGGGAMILAHRFPLATSDIDAIPTGIELTELAVLTKKVAETQNLPLDWLNPYFSTFTINLPPDYAKRLIIVFSGKFLRAKALGKEDMLIMKCFAHRPKDIAHGRNLVKNKADLKLVESHLAYLQEKGFPGVDEAIEFLDEILELEGI